MKNSIILASSLLALAAIPVHAAAVSYSFDWSDANGPYSQFAVSGGAFTTDDASQTARLARSTTGIMHLTTTTDSLSGRTGSYFDVKQGAVVISVASAQYNLGTGSSITGGHVGLFGIGSTDTDQWDYYWHPQSSNIGHAGRRPHDLDSGGVASTNTPPPLWSLRDLKTE